MTCSFRVGQKVVRIGGVPKTSIQATWPEFGKVYTIRAINDHGGDYVLLRLAEIDNSHLVPEHGSIEPGFHYSQFRPVIDRGTEKGMSILRDLLNKMGKPVEVVA